MHVVAAKAVAFKEALQPAFKAYQRQVVANARAMAAVIQQRGHKIVSGGTDNHLMLIDLSARPYTDGEMRTRRWPMPGSPPTRTACRATRVRRL